MPDTPIRHFRAPDSTWERLHGRAAEAHMSGSAFLRLLIDKGEISMPRERYEVRPTDGPVSANVLQGVDAKVLPATVWDNERGLAFGRVLCICPTDVDAQIISAALNDTWRIARRHLNTAGES